MSGWHRSGAAVVLAAPFLLAASLAWGQNADLIRERIKTRPDDPTLYYWLATAEIAGGRHAAGLAALEQVARLGVGFLPPRRSGFDAVWDDPEFQRIRGVLERRLPRVTIARTLFRLDRGLIPEGIAYDPASRTYFVGSIAAAKVVRVDAHGRVTDFSRPGEVDAVLGMVVDARRRRLHAVTTSALVTVPARTPLNRIVSWDLDTGTKVGSIEIRPAAQLNDVTVGPVGELYATDSRAGGVYRIAAGGSIDALATLPGANGLALSADGSALYVAHSTGIARVPLAGGGALLPRLEIPAGETVAAIDGLYADGNTLIGIQNVTHPGRVIRIRLRADGRGAERIETLLSHHHPAIDEPTTGVVVDRSFALLATTQVGRFTPQGRIDSPETLKPPVVVRIELDPER